MKHVITIDPSYRSSGLALARYGDVGPPVKVSARAGLDFKGLRRDEWAPKIGAVLIQLCAGTLRSPGEATWLIEDWDRHSNYDAAVRLAQVQQCFIDVGASVRATVHLQHWQWWQVPTGVNQAGLAAGRAARAAARRAGTTIKAKLDRIAHDAARAARSKAAKAWARAAFDLDRDPPEDVAQALCIAGVWVNEERQRAARLDF